jgi:hypothetical protein
MNDTGRPSEDTGIPPLPLVIGVSGHRDLRGEDREPLEARVRQIFAELQNRCPHTPLLLLSPLAEGADQLVARVALEKGVRLIVPLPMPQALYEEDFQTEASRDEFNTLLHQAQWCLELPLLQDTREEEVREPGPARDRQYAQVGAYIALHSQILIALWDGRCSDRVGSTSQVIQFQLQGVPEPYAPPHSPLDEPESGPVYHIVTPRVKNPSLVEQPFELRKLTPAHSTYNGTYYEQDGGADQRDSIDDRTGKKQNNERSLEAEQQESDRILGHLDTFNQDGIDRGPRLVQKYKQSKADLLGEMETTTLPPALKVTLDRYAGLYAVADALALYFKGRTTKTLFRLFSLVFLAVVCFDVFAHVGDYLVQQWGAGWEWFRFLFLALYLILLLIAYSIWYYRATRGHYMNKYLDYRALAEGLRVQFFWRLAGVPDTVATHYLRKQRSELDWIRNSIRVANLLCDAQSGQGASLSSGSVPPDRYRWILKRWVEDQGSYFTRATARDHGKAQGHERWVRRFFGTGIGLALGLLMLQLLLLPQLLPPPDRAWIDTTPLMNLLIVLMGLALVLAVLWEGYSDKMAYAEQVKQYQRTSHVFWLASQRLKDCLEQEKAQDALRVIRELGEEALAENGDWVLLHRARPLNVPIGR